MAHFTQIQDDELKNLIGQYGLVPASIQPVIEGWANSNYLLETTAGKFILTIFEVEPVRVEMMSRVLSLLEDQKFPAPRILKLPGGGNTTSFSGKPVMLKPYIPGRVIQKLNHRMLNQVGSACARLHSISPPDYLMKLHSYESLTLRKVLEEGQDQTYLSWLTDRCDILKGIVFSDLPSGLVHGDLFYDNVLFQGDMLQAFIDFEDVSHHPFVFDLGMAAIGLCLDGTRIVLEQVQALVDGYQEVRLLDELEKESMQDFIEYAAILTSTWRYWQYNINLPDPVNGDRYNEMVKIAEGVQQIPRTQFMQQVFS